MTDDIYYTLLDTTLTILRGMKWVSLDDSIPSIANPREQIRLGKIRREKDEFRGFENLTTPGLLLTPGNQEWPESLGVNNADDGFYFATVLLIVQDNQQYETGIRTWLKWLGMIRRRFNNAYNDWPVGSTDERGDIQICNTRQINTFDERYWVPHKKMVGAVELRWRGREAQGLLSDER